MAASSVSSAVMTPSSGPTSSTSGKLPVGRTGEVEQVNRLARPLLLLLCLVFRLHVGVDLHVDVGVANLVLDLFTGLLDIVADISSDVLGGVADVLGRIFCDVAVVGDAGRTVILVLADLAGAKQQKWNRECNSHGFL